MTKKSKDATFMEVTNRDIYEQILELKNSHIDFCKQNSIEHNSIISRQDHTNGKVKRATIVASGAISLAIILLGFLFQHLS